MAYKLIDENSLTLLANSIRECGYSGTLTRFPTDYITAIQEIGRSTFDLGLAYSKQQHKTSAKSGDSVVVSANVTSSHRSLAYSTNTDNLLKLMYIENTGDAYINTHYIPKAQDKIVIDCIIGNQRGSYDALFGCRNGSYSSRAFGLFTYFNSNNSCYYFRSGKEQWVCTPPRGQRIIIECQADHIIIKDQTSNVILTDYYITNCVIDDCLNECLIFDINTSTQESVVSRDNSKCYAKIYSFKVYDANNTLVVDLRPVCDESKTCAGMYDEVRNRFCQSEGTSSLVLGPEL